MDNATEKICPKCQTVNPIAANFCRHCGCEFQPKKVVKNKKDKPHTDALQEKIISLQDKIKDYDIREQFWQQKARTWFEKETQYKDKQVEMQRKIEKLKRQLDIEKKKAEPEKEKKIPSPQKKYSFKKLLIYTCIFIIGVLSHKCSCAGSNKQIEDNSQEIVPHEADLPAKEESYVPTDFVLVPGGILSYEGNYYEGYKKHKAEMDSFYICKFELTQGEYKRVIGSLNKENCMWLIVNSWYYYDKGPEYSEVRGDSIPVRGNYRLFAEYCNSRSKQEGFDGFYEIDGKNVTINPDGNGYRLITPYEWIFAAYGGNLNQQEKYLGGKTLSEVAWHYGNSGSKPHPVGLKKPNVIGLYDLQGNAPEILQGYKKPQCYISMCGRYNVSNWNYSQAYDPTYMCWLNKGEDEKEWTFGTRIAFIPKTIKNENLKIQYDYYE